MEQGNEGDEIILLAFKQIDCKIHEPISSLSQLGPEDLVKIAVKALYLISEGDISFSDELPSNIATRHRICTDIAGKIKELGYAGDCGYNQLLYPNPNQTRSILNWLMQKLPRSDAAEEVLTSSALFSREMSQVLTNWKRKCWSLDICASGQPLINSKSIRSSLTVDIKGLTYFPLANQQLLPEPTILEMHCQQLLSDRATTYDIDMLSEHTNKGDNSSGHQVKLSEQAQAWTRLAMRSMNDDHLFTNDMSSAVIYFGNEYANKTLTELVDIIESNDPAEKGQSGSRFAHASIYGQESSLSTVLGSSATVDKKAEHEGAVENDDADKRESVLTELRDTLQAEGDKFTITSSKLSELKSQLRHVDNLLAGQESNSELFENDILIKKKTLEMLPSALENIEKLRKICEAGSLRIVQLSQQWETHRQPIISKLRSTTNNRIKRRNKFKAMVDDMKKSKEEMGQMVVELKDKQAKSVALADEMKKLPRNLNRSVYTHRILDITASIGKQIKEIERVTNEIRGLQKTINQATSSLQRADAVAEDIIFTAANGQSKDAQMVEAYRQLRALRTSFDDLVHITSKTGFLERQSRQLETKIDQEKIRVSSQNIDRILNDLAEVVKSNVVLVDDIRKYSR